MIGLVTDSVSQMPPDLAARLAVQVVPVHVEVDGVRHRDGIDIDADAFWQLCEGGTLPTVKTSQPSPGEFAAVYRDLVAAGAEEIVSVHVGEDHSGTINSARLAAETVAVDVMIVDTGTASFGIGCCVWEAAEAIASGADAAEAAAVAVRTAEVVGTSFIIQALDFARAGGRFDTTLPDDADGVVVLAGVGGGFDVVATARTVDELCDRMVEPFVAGGEPIRAGVCLADPGTLAFTEGIEARLRASGLAVDLVRYRAGPSIAAHTGPGTAGGFWYPTGR